MQRSLDAGAGGGYATEQQLMVPARITNPEPAELSTVESRLAGGERLIVQFDEARYTTADLRAIDSLCARYGDALDVRFYGHDASMFDASTLSSIPSVVSLSIDCLQRVRNLGALRSLDNLRLSLGVFELEDNEVLYSPNLRELRSLSLRDTRTKRIDCSALAEYARLESLTISGHTRGIDAVSALPALTSLELWGISKRTSLGFVSKIRNLEHLGISLGGRSAISEVEAPKLRELQIARVLGLAELGELGRFPKLSSLAIEDQIRLERLELSAANAELRELRVMNCKTLRAVSGLEHLSQLRQLRIGWTALDPDAFLDSRLPGELEICAIYTAKERENRRILSVLDARGYREF